MSLFKRILSITMAVIAVFCSIPFTSFADVDWSDFALKAEASYTSGNYTYTVENGEATITYLGSGYATDLVIPSELDGYSVVALGDRFCNISSLKSLTIPDSVKSIGSEAFYNLSTSGIVNIGSGLEEIGDRAFIKMQSSGFVVSTDNEYFCNDDSGVLYNKDKTELVRYPAFKTTLREYKIPSTVETIGDYAFRGASQLYDVTLSDNLKYIEEGAFYSSSCEITALPSGLLEIGEKAFAYNSRNDSFKIPSTVTLIHPTAFMANSSLDYITVATDNANYSSLEGVLFNKDQTELITFPKLKNVIYRNGTMYGHTPYTVPSTVERIGEYAFSEAYIVEVVIPSNVKTVGEKAFYNCPYLESVTLNEGVETLENGAFEFDVYGSKSLLTDITIPVSLSSFSFEYFPDNCVLTVADGNPLYSTDETGTLFSADKTILYKYSSANENTEYEVPSTVEIIRHKAFYSNTKLTKVILPANLEEIESYAFYKCTALERVEAASDCKVRTIGECAFYYCQALNYIFPLKYVEVIGPWAFLRCLMLSEIYLYACLEEVGYYAFGECYALETVHYSSDYSSWKKVVVADANEKLLNATFVYNTHAHEYGDWRVFTEATCSEAGENERVCSVCNGKDYEAVAALGHSFTNYISNNDASCIKLETETARCDRCPVKDTRSIAGTKLPHSYVTDEAVAATCEATGLTEGEHCDLCGTVFVTQETEAALGHSFTNYIPDENADCYEGGTKTAKCDRCEKTEIIADEDSSALGHSFITVEAVEPTCEEVGYTESSHCSRCSLVIDEAEEVPALGHKKVLDKAVAATCENAGYTEGSHCERCGEVLAAQEIIPARGHVEVKDKAVAATCVKTGLTEGKHCSVCKSVTVEQRRTAALGHGYVTTNVKGSATADGKNETKCSRCGDVKSSVVYYKASNITLSKTSYTYDGKAKKPTVTVKTAAGTTLKSGTDYTVKYSNAKAKSIGSYSITITFMGNYSGSVTMKYSIVPDGTSIKSLKAKSAGMTVTWNKKIDNVTGYQIEYSTNSSFKSSKTVTISKNSTASKAISGLKGDKKYYVRVRTYKTVGKAKYYSAWSKAKSITTKPEINVTLNSTKLKLYLGETKTLKASTYPSKVDVTWKTSDKSVVSVSAGKLNALKKGSATITASFKYNGKTYKTTCKVTVSKPSVSLSESSASLEAGQSLTLKATVNPSGGKLKWTTSNSKVATVNSNGKITAKSNGTATITAAYTYKGKTYKKTCKITVSSLLQQLEENFSVKLIIPSVGSATNSYCTVKFINNTNYDVTLSMHVYANGKGCSNSNASDYVVKSGYNASATFYRDLVPEYRYKTKDMYLDNYSTAWTIITVNGKKVYVKFEAQGNTRFGYTAADIDEF